jgi:hypothetical protein
MASRRFEIYHRDGQVLKMDQKKMGCKMGRTRDCSSMHVPHGNGIRTGKPTGRLSTCALCGYTGLEMRATGRRMKHAPRDTDARAYNTLGIASAHGLQCGQQFDMTCQIGGGARTGHTRPNMVLCMRAIWGFRFRNPLLRPAQGTDA